jgi:hypothetical protein
MEERSRHAQREPQQIIIMTIKIHKWILSYGTYKSELRVLLLSQL